MLKIMWLSVHLIVVFCKPLIMPVVLYSLKLLKSMCRSQTHCVDRRHGGDSVEPGFGARQLSAQHRVPEGGLAV